jgi:glycosyltransferase involved in cell wall biosynthesis
MGVYPEHDSVRQIQWFDWRQPYHLLFVGRIAPNKGFKSLVLILSELVKKYGYKFVFHFVGTCYTPAYLDDLQLFISKHQLMGFVRFHGSIGAAGLKTFYKNSDVFISASEHEGFFVPGIEALAFELPVIALKTSAVADTLNGGAQFVDSLSQFPEQIMKILNLPRSKRSQITQAGLEVFEQRFSQRMITKQFDQILMDQGVM